MITMNQSLIDLYRRQKITYQEAVNRSPDPEDLKKLMQKTLSVMG
jgi:Tfp pilus assembly ATPase PilU